MMNTDVGPFEDIEQDIDIVLFDLPFWMFDPHDHIFPNQAVAAIYFEMCGSCIQLGDTCPNHDDELLDDDRELDYSDRDYSDRFDRFEREYERGVYGDIY